MDNEAKNLYEAVAEAAAKLKIQDLLSQRDQLIELSENPKFWDDQSQATQTMQEISRLDQRIKPWESLINSAKELVELASMNDSQINDELEKTLKQESAKFEELKRELMFAGQYDDHGAVISVSAGAGGTDAQDWTQILFRMYSRFTDKMGWKVKIIEESPGEEAGLKNIVFEVSGGNFIYGQLKSEHGVHRLVRLSPFNADHLRQTSFAKVEVLPKIESPQELELNESDLKIDVFRSGGHGGQSVNTTDSAVRVTHIPTGLSVAIQNERSQLQNRETALSILRSRLAKLQIEQHAEHLSEIKGPNQSAEWGNQIRSYVMHPYKQVKDLRSKFETSDIDSVINGNLESLINAYLEAGLGSA